jgi:hypothetical protein
MSHQSIAAPITTAAMIHDVISGRHNVVFSCGLLARAVRKHGP